jgi:hypothetical protein
MDDRDPTLVLRLSGGALGKCLLYSKGDGGQGGMLTESSDEPMDGFFHERFRVFSNTNTVSDD